MDKIRDKVAKDQKLQVIYHEPAVESVDQSCDDLSLAICERYDLATQLAC